MFKRCLLLLKCILRVELGVLNAVDGKLSSYSLAIMTIRLFNKFPESDTSMLSFLRLFFSHYSKLDWSKKGVSVFGEIDIESVLDSHSQADFFALSNSENLPISSSIITSWRKEISSLLRNFDPNFRVGKMCVFDPFDIRNNVSVAVVSEIAFKKIVSEFSEMSQKLEKYFSGGIKLVQVFPSLISEFGGKGNEFLDRNVFLVEKNKEGFIIDLKKKCSRIFEKGSLEKFKKGLEEMESFL